jgi:hypothetical protein
MGAHGLAGGAIRQMREELHLDGFEVLYLT